VTDSVPEDETPASWWIYRGTGPTPATEGAEAEPAPEEVATPADLPAPPDWRRFHGEPAAPLPAPEPEKKDVLRRKLGGHPWTGPSGLTRRELNLINAALLLRRPLLVSGRAGTGKSTLAYSIAAELGLGRVLAWPITSRSSLQEGLYHYDAIGRLQEAGIADRVEQRSSPIQDIGRYIRLNSLGTALLPWERPRVLLIDEIDKSDVDLPNDLLTAFEDGHYQIPELARVADRMKDVEVMPADGGRRVTIRAGEVHCRAFPIVVLTSNGERDFPPPFLRRCIRLNLHRSGPEWVTSVLNHQLGQDIASEGRDLVSKFVDRTNGTEEVAIDQLLNAVYVAAKLGQDGMDLQAGLLGALTSRHRDPARTGTGGPARLPVAGRADPPPIHRDRAGAGACGAAAGVAGAGTEGEIGSEGRAAAAGRA
jgi:MoxR-like ATPase